MLFLISSLSHATQPVRNAYTNVVVSVCGPSDSNSNCGGGSGSGTVSSGTIGQEAVYTGTTTVGSGVITDNGNVGIGTTTPAGGLVVMNGNVGIGTWAPVNEFQINNNANSVVVSSVGNVGIGTYGTPSPLTIVNNGTGGITTEAIRFWQPSNLTTAYIGNYLNSVGTPDNFIFTKTAPTVIAFDNSNETVVYGNIGIDANSNMVLTQSNGGNINLIGGNVGIGSTNPQGSLDVEGTIQPIIFSANAASSNSNVGIGSFMPGTKLDVNGTIRMKGFKDTTAPTNGFVMTSDASGNGTWAAASGGTGSNYWQLGNVGINTTNNVGIGSVNPGQALDVVGTIRAIQILGSNAASKPPVTITVATSTSRGKNAADYVLTGTSDQTIINTALTAASATNGTVKLLDGTANISAPILIPSNTTFDFSGATIFQSNSTSNQATGTAMLENASFPNSDSNITVMGGTLDANGANQSFTINDYSYTNGAQTIWFQKVTNLVINNLTITRSWGWSTRIVGCAYVRMNNVHFNNAAETSNQDGIHLTDTSYAIVDGVTGTTEDDGMVVDAEKANAQYISFNNVAMTGLGARIRLTNADSFFTPTPLGFYVQNINFSNLSLSPNTYGPFLVYNYQGDSFIRNVTINNMVVNETNNTSGTDGAAFNFQTIGASHTMQNLNVNNCTVTDDGNAVPIYNLNSGSLNINVNCQFYGFASSSITPNYLNAGLDVGVGTYVNTNALNVLGGIAFGSYAGTKTVPPNNLATDAYVGIGTWSPQAHLEVAGATFIGAAYVNNGDSTNTDGLAVVGNIGAGNPTPGAPLSFNSSNGDKIHLANDSSPFIYGIGIGAYETQFYAPTAGAGSPFHFSFNSGGQLNTSGTNEIMRIMTSGDVGIGSQNPGQVLDVNGNIRVIGAIYAASQPTPPSIASNACGSLTQGTVVTNSTDLAGSVTAGTAAGSLTACAITFGQSHTTAPASCVCQDGTTPLALAATYSTTTLTCTSLATVASGSISYQCQWNKP